MSRIDSQLHIVINISKLIFQASNVQKSFEFLCNRSPKSEKHFQSCLFVTFLLQQIFHLIYNAYNGRRNASCIPIMHKRENVINKIGLWHQMMMIGSIILAIPHRARQQFFVGAARICCMSFMTLNCQLIVKCKRSSCAFCHQLRTLQESRMLQ